jgi:hypothetical protein
MYVEYLDRVQSPAVKHNLTREIDLAPLLYTSHPFLPDGTSNLGPLLFGKIHPQSEAINVHARNEGKCHPYGSI